MSDFSKYPQERKFFSEDAAIRVEYVSHPRMGTVDLVRFFATSRLDLVASGVAMLDKYVSVKNEAYIEAGLTIDWVDDPWVDRKPIPGRFRLVSNKQGQDPNDPSRQGIIQHLRLSSPTVFVALTGDSVTNGEQTTIYGDNLTPIDVPASVQGALYRSANILTPDGFYNSQLVYEYSKGHVFSAKTGDSVTNEEQTTIYANSLSRIEAATAGQGMLYRANNSINPDGTYQGQLVYEAAKGHVFSAKTGDSVTNEEQTTIYANSLSRIEAATAGQGMLYRANNSINPDGTYQGQLVYEAAKGHVFSAKTGDSVTNVERTTIYANSLSRIEAATAGQGMLYRANNSINPDGTYQGQLVYEAAKGHVFSAKTGDSVTNVERTTIYANSLSRIEAATAGQGMLYRANNSINPDGTYQGQLVYEAAKGHVFSAKTGDSVTNEEQTTLYANSLARIEAATAGQGMLYRASNSINPDGTYQGQLVYEAAKRLYFSVATEDTGLSHTDTQIYAHSLTKLDAGTSVQGGIYRASNSLNPDGTYNGDLVYQGSKARTVSWSFNTLNGVASNSIYLNQTSIPSLSDLTYGTKNSVGVGINPDLTYDVSISVDPVAGATTGGSIIGTFNDGTLIRRQYRKDFTEYRTVTITCSVRMTAGRGYAYAHIAGSMDGSKVERDGGTYIATKYTCSFSAWTTMPATEPSIPAA